MVYKSFKRLSPLRIEQIHKLEKICLEKDKALAEVFCEPDFNFTSSVPAFFFATVNNEAIGVLTLFLPGDDSAEISALVHPAYRKQGIFTDLFRLAKESVSKLNCSKILLVATPGIPATLKVLSSLKAKLSTSEYKMALASVPEKLLSTAQPEKLKLIRATKKDIPEIARMDATFFDSDYEFSLDWLSSLSSLKSTHIFKLVSDKQLIGTAAFSTEGKTSTIFGVGILAEYRGKGYGRLLLTELLKNLPKGNSVLLQVSSINAVAFELYKKLGFNVISQQDFYLV